MFVEIFFSKKKGKKEENIISVINKLLKKNKLLLISVVIDIKKRKINQFQILRRNYFNGIKLNSNQKPKEKQNN